MGPSMPYGRYHYYPVFEDFAENVDRRFGTVPLLHAENAEDLENRPPFDEAD